ncbi:hypothetical protein HAX54_006332, partial [Datura stramonium]|nr:hypothetical protein [Datura stramonium]
MLLILGLCKVTQKLITLLPTKHNANFRSAVVAKGSIFKHFLSLKPPEFYRSLIMDDLQYFMDDTFKGLRAMGSHGSKVMEFVAYQLKDETHTWFEMCERESFTYLTRYVMYMIPTENQKLRRFLRGLMPHIKSACVFSAMSPTCTFESLWASLRNKKVRRIK